MTEELERVEGYPNLVKGYPGTHFKKGDPRAIEMGKKGQEASAKSKALRRSFAELGKAMLNAKPSKAEIARAKDLFPGLEEEEITNRVLMIREQMFKAIRDGDSKAFEIIRDTVGERPSDKLEMTGKDGESLNMEYKLTPATKEAIEKEKSARETIED